MKIIYQIALLMVAFTLNALASLDEEEPARKIIISPANAQENLWEVKYSSRKEKDGSVIHFFDCILTLKSKVIKPYWDELTADINIRRNGKIASRYEPRIWVNARPFRKGTSNYSIKCAVGDGFCEESTIEVWIDRPTIPHTLFIIELGKFAK